MMIIMMTIIGGQGEGLLYVYAVNGINGFIDARSGGALKAQNPKPKASFHDIFFFIILWHSCESSLFALSFD